MSWIRIEKGEKERPRRSWNGEMATATSTKHLQDEGRYTGGVLTREASVSF
jgi:hypothetical protein